MIVDVLVPIRTVTGMNVREHPMARSRRVKKEKNATTMALLAYGAPTHQKLCRVLFVRVSPQLCDDDAIPPACKAVRDAIAKAFGVSDGPNKGIEWTYDQVRGSKGQFAVRVTIETDESRPVEAVANNQRRT